MVKVIVLAALVQLSGQGWVKGETLHPRLNPIRFENMKSCKLKKQAALKEFNDNREYLRDNYGVLRIKLTCTPTRVASG